MRETRNLTREGEALQIVSVPRYFFWRRRVASPARARSEPTRPIRSAILPWRYASDLRTRQAHLVRKRRVRHGRKRLGDRLYPPGGRLSASWNALWIGKQFRIVPNWTSRCVADVRWHPNCCVFSYLNAVGYHRNLGRLPKTVADGVPMHNARESSLWLVAGPYASLRARRHLSSPLLCDASLPSDQPA